MMLMLLLTKLIHLKVKVAIEHGHVKIQAPAGVLDESLRQAMRQQKKDVQRFAFCPYVVTIHGPGMLTGNAQECDVSFVAPERQERLRYRVGVQLLHNRVEQFYYPGMLLLARPEDVENYQRQHEVSL